MATHFLPRSRVRLAKLDSVPAHLCLFPGVLICAPGDLLNVESYGIFRVLRLAWGGANNDEADIAVEPVR